MWKTVEPGAGGLRWPLPEGCALPGRAPNIDGAASPDDVFPPQGAPLPFDDGALPKCQPCTYGLKFADIDGDGVWFLDLVVRGALVGWFVCFRVTSLGWDCEDALVSHALIQASPLASTADSGIE